MAKKADVKLTAETPRRRVASLDSSLRASAPPRLKPSSLLDTRVTYDGDNLEQLKGLRDFIAFDYMENAPRETHRHRPAHGEGNPGRADCEKAGVN